MHRKSIGQDLYIFDILQSMYYAKYCHKFCPCSKYDAFGIREGGRDKIKYNIRMFSRLSEFPSYFKDIDNSQQIY